MRRIFFTGVILTVACFFTSLLVSQTTHPVEHISVSHVSNAPIHAVHRRVAARGHFGEAARAMNKNYRKGGASLIKGGGALAADTMQVEPLRGVGAFGKGVGFFAKDIAVGTAQATVAASEGTGQAGWEAGTRTVSVAKSAGRDTQQAAVNTAHGTAQVGAAIGSGFETFGRDTKEVAVKIDHGTDHSTTTATQDAKNIGQKIGNGTSTVADNVAQDTNNGINAVKRTFGRVF